MTPGGDDGAPAVSIVAPADTEAPAPVLGLTVAAVARRLGVAPATLRTWDRRYDLGPSDHAAGSHRRYTPQDVDRLLVMRGLTLDGVAPSDAARVARESAGGPAGAASRHGVPHQDGHRGTVTALVRSAPTPTLVIDAALRGDEAACRALLDVPAGGSISQWWLELVEPVRAGLATRTVLARPGEEADALVVGGVLEALRRRTSPQARAHVAGRRVVLLHAAPGEPRPLVLHVLAAALAERGVDARVVAGLVEPHRMLEIATMTRPAAVVIVTELATPDLSVIGALAAARPDVPQFVSVPDDGVADDLPLGHSVHRARSFTGLLHEVLAVST